MDQIPIASGDSAKEAIQTSIDLAQHAEELGYERFWVAEHHDLPGLACPAPDVMLGIIGAQTNSIRIGSGAVLLPHYKPYKIAETYNLLATLFPGRVDLGIGRAPGGSAEAAIALSGNFLEQVRKLPESLDELLRFLHHDFPKDHMFSKIKPSPVPEVSPEPWLLGTSEKSAELAAEKGMAYAFGQFMSDQDGPTIVQKYREKFLHKYSPAPSKVIVAVTAVCADTTKEAEEIAMSSQLWNIQRAKGEGENGIPSVIDAKNHPYTNDEREMILKAKHKMIIGNPSEVREQLIALENLYDADELMIVTITHSSEARVKSYKLIAKELIAGN